MPALDPRRSMVGSSDDRANGWVSQVGVEWVIEDAPVPAELAWTLVVIARRAGADGRNSYQSIATLAAKTGKSEKQARRDVTRLRELELIVPGDQSLVEHLPIGQRPTVYDLPLQLKGPKPSKESRNPTGLKAETTPPMDGTPPAEGTPPMDGDVPPPMDGSGTPPMDGSQIRPLKKTEEQSSSARSSAVAYICKRLGLDDDDEAAWIIKTAIGRAAGPLRKTEGAYLRGIKDGDYADMRAEYRAAPAESPTPRPRPVHCGNCDPDTRLTELPDGRPTRCPECHPLVVPADQP
jgi:hypothetical protein